MAQKPLILKVKNKYIVADTSGKLIVDKRLDDVEHLSHQFDCYQLGYQNKFGVLSRGEVIIPIAYDRISMLNRNQLYRAFAVKKNGQYALFNGLGKIQTDFEYTNIVPYYSDYYMYSGNGNFYLKFMSPKGIQLGHIDANNTLVWDMTTPVESLNDRKNIFVFKRDNTWALYKSSDGFSTLQKLTDFSELVPYLGYDFIYLTNEKEKYVLKYDYNFKLIKRFNNTTKNDEYPIDMEIASVEDGVYAVEAPEWDRSRLTHSELEYRRALIFSGKEKDLAQDFRFNERVETHIPSQDKYQATVHVAGKKGNFQATIYYTDEDHRPIKDTVLQLPYDQVIVPLAELNVYLIVRKGKQYGVVDTRGNLAVPVSYKAIEICTHPSGMQWIIKRSEESAELEFYDSESRLTTSLLKLGQKDKIRFEANYFFVELGDGKAKGKISLYKWYFYSIYNRVHIAALPLYGRYDKIETLKSYPFFFETTTNNRKGLIGKLGNPVIPALYDSIRVVLIYEFHESTNELTGKLVPVIFAYRGQEMFYLNKANEFKGNQGIAHEGKPIRVSDDGLFLFKEMGNGKVQLFAQNGAPLHSGTVQLDETNQYFVSHYKWYWYVIIKDAENRDVILGRNGVQIVLPE